MDIVDVYKAFDAPLSVIFELTRKEIITYNKNASEGEKLPLPPEGENFISAIDPEDAENIIKMLQAKGLQITDTRSKLEEE